MDKLTAYRILGLANNASTEEVKEVYARLSKEYHPEENPEEFQRIHEAYTTLTRRGRRGNRAMVVESSPIEKTATPEVKESDLVFRNITKVEEEESKDEQAPELSFGRSIKAAKEQQNEQEEQEQSAFDFDSSIQQAQKSEEELFILNTQMCIEELKTLFALPNCNDVKKFKQFFGRKECQKIFYTPQFVQAVAEYVSKIDLRYSVYSYLIKFYQLKNKKVENLIPEAQYLYHMIDRHYSVKADAVGSAKSSIVLGGIGGLAYPVFKWGPRILKQFIKNGLNFNPAVLEALIPLIVAVFVCIFLYKFFCKKNYVYVAMRKTCGAIFLFSVASYILEPWALFFSTGNSPAQIIPMLFMAISAPLWIVSIFASFYSKTKRKENDAK